MHTSATFSIAELLLSFKWNSEKFKIYINDNLAAFSVLMPEVAMSHILFSINGQHSIDIDSYKIVFNNLSNGTWNIWKAKDDSSFLISLHGNGYGNEPHQIIIANNHLSDCQVLNMDGECNLNLLDFPLELVISGYLNINKVGILLHSALISINGTGILFPGMSGSGKSSISALCIQDKDFEVFTDETVIIREKYRILHAFGTPWHSTQTVYKNKGVPLAKIFFLKHGKENSLRKISNLDAANRLLVRCFPTFWHKEGMQFALDFCTHIASKVECYEFSFVPDLSVVKFIKENII